MKTQFKIGAIALTLFLASCGGGEDSNEPQYACECNTLVVEKGISTLNGEPYTGACATLSKDRAREITFLAEYIDGFAVKNQRWQIFNNERILTEEVTFDDKNKKSGYRIFLGKAERIDSSTNTKYAIRYTETYEEWKDDRSIYRYTFGKYDDPETSYEHSYIGAERVGYRFRSEDKELINLTENFLPIETVPDPLYFMGDERTMEKRIMIESFNFKDPQIKKYFDRIESNKSKIKKWILKEMKIDETSSIE